ncbi:MAG: helix-hairpin-helix domain-containing protein [Bacteroidetes bacterium]|nr:helix-hairpin-helix domain-containing protein [Bacteroidota bacterium]
MKNILRDYFTFNRRERNGVFVLLSIIFILILYLSFADYFFPKAKTDFSKFEKEIAQFEAEQKRISDSVSSEKNYFTSGNTPEADIAERFSFNPNNLSEEDWKRLGLSDKQIHTIKNYESKGGKFRSKEDVRKMYCISPQLYASLEPYIQIPDSDKKPTTFQSKQHALTPLSLDNQAKSEGWERSSWAGGEVVELNSSDTIALDKLKGIGFAYAKRIIKYRDLLGGFVKKEQLLEVYGFDKEKYDGLAENISVNLMLVKKININTATLDELKKHPYIKYRFANLIVNYRKQHGNYISVDGIKKIDTLDEELYGKIAPYLTIE